MQKPLVIITGASSGIGAATAKIFSAANYPLGLFSRNLAAMQALNLPQSICLSVDVRNAQALQDAVKTAEEMFGPTDCMINNAGYAKSGDFLAISQEDHESMLAINVMGVINGVTAVLSGMRERKRGTIINVSSLADRVARPHIATYAASKAAVKSLSTSLQQSNAKYNIRITNLAPGKILTPILTAAKIDVANSLPAELLAKMILWIYEQPQELCIRDLLFAETMYEN